MSKTNNKTIDIISELNDEIGRLKIFGEKNTQNFKSKIEDSIRRNDTKKMTELLEITKEINKFYAEWNRLKTITEDPTYDSTKPEYRFSKQLNEFLSHFSNLEQVKKDFLDNYNPKRLLNSSKNISSTLIDEIAVYNKNDCLKTLKQLTEVISLTSNVVIEPSTSYAKKLVDAANELIKDHERIKTNKIEEITRYNESQDDRVITFKLIGVAGIAATIEPVNNSV